ncbi:MAG: hypothetical protein DRI01_00705 [Chloroflexi bacterium]|nr:MAG: hypothetical protein DRI01_00705 [Chloroflexota bacterium]
MSTYIKLKSGSVSWGTNGLIAQVSERAPVRLVKEQGFLLINGYVRAKIGSDSEPTLRPVKIELGCLNDDWNLTQSIETVTVPNSCKGSDYTINKSAKWKFSAKTKQVEPVLFSMLTGANIYEPSSSLKLKIYVEETQSVSSNAITLDNTPYRIIAVINEATNTYFHEVNTLADDDEYTLSGNTLTFNSLSDGTVIKIKYVYESTTASDGLIIAPSSTSFPKHFGGMVSWLAVGDTDGVVGRIIAEFDDATRTNEITFGGTANEFLELMIEGDINGDVVFYWQEFE